MATLTLGLTDENRVTRSALTTFARLSGSNIFSAACLHMGHTWDIHGTYMGHT